MAGSFFGYGSHLLQHNLCYNRGHIIGLTLTIVRAMVRRSGGYSRDNLLIPDAPLRDDGQESIEKLLAARVALNFATRGCGNGAKADEHNGVGR